MHELRDAGRAHHRRVGSAAGPLRSGPSDVPRPVGRSAGPFANPAPAGTRPARGGGRVRGLHGRAECPRVRGDGQRDTTDEGLGTVRNRLAGLDSESLTDTCDEHYEAWQALWVQEDGFRWLDINILDEETEARYDYWMERCHRVLGPVAAAGP